MRRWYEIDPKDAVDLDLSEDLSITAPVNEMGERCPWPWEPQQLVGVPMGQYHCPYCGAMVMAGEPHLDYDGLDEEIEKHARRESRFYRKGYWWTRRKLGNLHLRSLLTFKRKLR